MSTAINVESISYVEQYLEPLADYIKNDTINELVINPDGKIFVEYSGAHNMEAIEFELPEQSIRRLAAQLAGESHHTLGPAHPIVSGRVVVWGSPLRVQIVIEPAVEYGISLSIRKYMTKVLDPEKLKFVEGSQFDVESNRLERHNKIRSLAEKGDLQDLFRKAIDQKFNILISGGTSSGKTTVARSLISMAERGERLITIEDAQELYPPHLNQVALIADREQKSQCSPSFLLESCLRMRPDRIILGEIRGIEAYDFLEAINTGHPGAITTIHSDSPELAFDRLALMVMRAGVPMSHPEIINYAKKTIDLVIQVGRREGRRGILEVYIPSQQQD